MNLNSLISKLFGNKSDHDMREIQPYVEQIKQQYEVTDKLSNDELRARTKALRDLHRRLGAFSLLDPAAGSGNFLTESYVSLRRLENRVLLALADTAHRSQTALVFEESDDEAAEDDQVLVSLRSFHGIEVEDYACCVARTALWIAEKQMDAETQQVTHRVYQELPL